MTDTRAPQDLLGQLHAYTAAALIKKVLSGDATAAEMANAIRFLKDNGIEAVAAPGSALQQLMDSLPDFPDQPQDGLPN